MVLANIFGSDGLIVVVIALVVIFGGSQLPKIARNVGSAGREFRKAQAEAEAEEAAKAAQATPSTPPAVAAAPVEAAPVAPKADDSITLSKADLEALLDERAKRQQSAS